MNRVGIGWYQHDRAAGVVHHLVEVGTSDDVAERMVGRLADDECVGLLISDDLEQRRRLASMNETRFASQPGSPERFCPLILDALLDPGLQRRQAEGRDAEHPLAELTDPTNSDHHRRRLKMLGAPLDGGVAGV
jgi:hypothetical protein